MGKVVPHRIADNRRPTRTEDICPLPQPRLAVAPALPGLAIFACCRVSSSAITGMRPSCDANVRPTTGTATPDT